MEERAATDNHAERSEGQAYREIEEVTLKFGRGCAGEEFQGRDGNSYREILVPNPDRNDHRPWQTFVAKSNHVHENRYGKGMWLKLPADGSTTLRRNVKAGQDGQGRAVWEVEKTRVANRELKKMVESYKERIPMKERIAGKKEEAARRNPAERAADKARPLDAAL